MSPEDRAEMQALVAELIDTEKDRSTVSRYVEELLNLRQRVRQAEADNRQLARHRRTDDLNLEETTAALVQSLRRRIDHQTGRIERLQEAVAEACESNQRKNLELDAMHWVWCDGGCDLGVHRYSQQNERVTQAIVALAIRNTERLQKWYGSREYRKRRGELEAPRDHLPADES